jgi:hypothetical protein
MRNRSVIAFVLVAICATACVSPDEHSVSNDPAGGGGSGGITTSSSCVWEETTCETVYDCYAGLDNDCLYPTCQHGQCIFMAFDDAALCSGHSAGGESFAGACRGCACVPASN